MCFSAEVWQDYREYVKQYGAIIDIATFAKLFYERRGSKWFKIPKGLELAFSDPKTEEERAIKAEIDAYNIDRVKELEPKLFEQRRRLADAERKLAVKETKTAREEIRKAGNSIKNHERWIHAAKRTKHEPSTDDRIFPMSICPVMVVENGQRLVRAMRYLLRPPGAPPSWDTNPQTNGTYNARRDNLRKFWKGQFGHTHGLIIASTFYENVELPNGENGVLQFTPRTGEPMLVACIWAEWVDPKGKEPSFYGFAAVTDLPEPEVAATGHDRTVINIKPEHVDAWLNPDSSPEGLELLDAIMDDKRHPYYEHRKAA